MRTAACAAALIALTFPLTAIAAGPGKATTGEPARAAATAARGDAEAQYQAGLAARKRRGADSLRQAYVWFGLAAVHGNAAAAVEAAKACEEGAGVPRSLEHAGQWWYRAAQLGDMKARQRWADLFVAGQIRSVGGIEGASWIGDLARRGQPRAAIALAAAYEAGAGIAPDPAQAESWLRRAALLQADAEARTGLGRLLLSRPAAWRVPDDESWTVKDAERHNRPLGPVWYATQPTDAGDKAVHLRPGIDEGARWLTLAAEDGDAEAQYALGKALAEGSELAIDQTTAARWLEAAAHQRHPAATMLLAGMAARGEGFPGKDPLRAYVLYDRAAQLGQTGAAEARDALGKSLGRQLGRARQLAEELNARR